MKTILFDIENQVDKVLIGDAHEIVRATQEYDLNSPEPGKYQLISRNPDYHVEIQLKEEGVAIAKCYCPVYKRSGKCKHAVGALLILRDHLKSDRKSRKKQMKETLDMVLSKMRAGDLKSFISTYALSHASLRSELLSNYLFLLRKPDYHQLFHELAPIDKYGQVRINRNNLKSIRSACSTLLKRSRHLLEDQSLAESLNILEAVLTHLHRLHGKIPQYSEQLMVELRHAYKQFELLCHQSMAPRLQQRSTELALEICNRDAYVFPIGMSPLISFTDQFFLEEKTRKEAFQIAEQKVIAGHHQVLAWLCLLYHWMNIWQFEVTNNIIRQHLEKMLPLIVKELYHQGKYRDVVFAVGRMDKGRYEDSAKQSLLQAAFHSARFMGEIQKEASYAYELATYHFDFEAWLWLFEKDKSSALRSLRTIEDLYLPGNDHAADMLLLKGWNLSHDFEKLIARLKLLNDPDLLMEFDTGLREKLSKELVEIYADYILYVNDTYGGNVARQKLNNIFSHLRAIDLHTELKDRLKTKQKAKEKPNEGPMIKGFVFDLDGVIVDTAVHHFQSWKKILKTLGADITEEDDHHTRGAGRMESLEYLLERYRIRLTDDEKVAWASRKNDVYLEAINTISPDDLLPGALSFLEGSRKMGLLLALGSASKNAGTVLQKLDVRRYFDAIVDGNDIKASKPDPEIFIKACAALGLEPSTVVVFEDAPKGVQAAISAGCKTVGIGEFNNLSEADVVVSGLDQYSPEEIIEKLV